MAQSTRTTLASTSACNGEPTLPVATKSYVFNYGLEAEGSKKICLEKPPVLYCKWSLKSTAPEADPEEVVAPEP